MSVIKEDKILIKS